MATGKMLSVPLTVLAVFYAHALTEFVSPTYDTPVLTSNSTCRSYTCVDLPGTECMHFTYQGVLLDTCGEQSYCPMITEGISHCKLKSYSVPQKWPGEFCTNGASCLHGQCENRRCMGNNGAEPCTNHEDCHVGLHCSRGLCIAQIEAGRFGCRSDYDCKNNVGCLEGRCISYFSLKEGDRIEHCEDGVSFLCESTICYKHFCLARLKNDNPIPTPCNSSKDCISTYYSSNLWSLPFYKECVCNYSGQGYCQLFPGDQPFIKYMERLTHWTEGRRIHQCHTLRRFSEDCMKEISDERHTSRHLNAYYKVHHFPQIQQISDCAREMFEPKAYVCEAVALFAFVLVYLL